MKIVKSKKAAVKKPAKKVVKKKAYKKVAKKIQYIGGAFVPAIFLLYNKQPNQYLSKCGIDRATKRKNIPYVF